MLETKLNHKQHSCIKDVLTRTRLNLYTEYYTKRKTKRKSKK